MGLKPTRQNEVGDGVDAQSEHAPAGQGSGRLPLPLRKNRVAVVLLFLLAVGTVILACKGIRRIWRINDFDVIRHGAVLAAQRSPDLYRLESREGRHFLYPPQAAWLLIPLGWLPYHLGGVLATFLRLGVLAVLVLVTARWLQDCGWLGKGQATLLVIFGGIAISWRSIDNDFGNGQINLFLAGFSIAGLWMAFRQPTGWQWLGGFLIATAGAVKVTPLIFGGVLLLHRRWHALASCVVCLLVITGASAAWFGGELFARLLDDFDFNSRQQAWKALRDVRVISLPDFINSVAWRWGTRLRTENVGQWWLIESVVAGGLYLVVRQWKFRRGERVSPLWEVSAFAIFSILLSPMVRKAHLVMLVVPAMVGLAFLYGKRSVRQPLVAHGLFWLGALLTIWGEAFTLNDVIPGLRLRPGILFGLLLLLAMFFSVRQGESPPPHSTNGGEAQESHDGVGSSRETSNTGIRKLLHAQKTRERAGERERAAESGRGLMATALSAFSRWPAARRL